ncbi:hypothetical protein CDD81_1461 [Ophiocordyceps australis]|uniref:DUF924-domain-containing protein n=1 Tax=Ophiocordyceps australis TaxID=1399860 RepID=A0A2C5YFI0_9HYPO|nr:hypothetical protein CDD81_1461 [Ophiocordyceps australis]
MAHGDTKFQPSLVQLREVHDFWYEQLTRPEDFVLPEKKHNEHWFFGNEAFDQMCVKSGITSGNDILEAVQLDDPLDWVSLIILLDQIPRNCYRGDSAAIAFSFFDPMARDVALAAAKRGLPEANPQIRWQLAYRKWFYLPFVHAEDMEAHVVATQGFEMMRKDVYDLTEETDGEEELEAPQGHERPDYRARARKAIQANVARSRLTLDTWADAEKRHVDIIKRFGRFPHRNDALGRTSTMEEREYLENGGETFARPKSTLGVGGCGAAQVHN